jgi:hypothetical protein
MNLTIIGVIRGVKRYSTFIVSDLMQRLYGSTVAQADGAILFTTLLRCLPYCSATPGPTRLPRTAAFSLFSDGFIARIFHVRGTTESPARQPSVQI